MITDADIKLAFGEVMAWAVREDGTLVVVHANGQKKLYPNWQPPAGRDTCPTPEPAPATHKRKQRKGTA